MQQGLLTVVLVHKTLPILLHHGEHVLEPLLNRIQRPSSLYAVVPQVQRDIPQLLE